MNIEKEKIRNVRSLRPERKKLCHRMNFILL